jgi:hypothetical protein
MELCSRHVPSGFPSDAHGKHRRAFATFVRLSQILPITSLFCAFSMMAYLIFQCLISIGESDVHLSSPAIIVLVHKASYLEVPLYFCSIMPLSGNIGKRATTPTTGSRGSLDPSASQGRQSLIEGRFKVKEVFDSIYPES